MDEREELQALRRLAQLESKAKGVQPATDEKPDAAAGGSTLKFGPLNTGIPLSENVNNFLAGAGQNIQGLATGISQYLPGGATRDEVIEQRRLDADLNKRKAAMAGNLLSNLPLAMLPGGASMRGAAVIGGATGAAQSSASTTETLGNMTFGAAGGAAGQMIGNSLSRIINGRNVVPPRVTNTNTQNINVGPSNSSASATVNATPSVSLRNNQNASIPMGDDVSAGITQAQRVALERARQQGFRVTPGQSSGSRVLQQVESKLESQPMTSGPFFDIKEGNQRILNRRFAEAIGEDADNLSPAVLDAAYTRMGNVFDSVADDIPRAIDPDNFLNRLAAVEADSEGMLAQPLLDNSLVRRYLTLASNGQPTGAQLNNLQSQIGKAAQSLRANDPAQAQALREVQHLILDDIGSGLAPEAQAAFNQARQQYRTFSMLADKPQNLNPSTGNVSGPNLANSLQRTDRAGYALGRNESELYDAVRFSKAFPAVVGNSGTATRMPLNALEAVLSVPMNVATRAYTSSPSVSATNAITSVLERGVAPNSMSPTNANALRRLLAVGGGVGGAAATPLVFGN